MCDGKIWFIFLGLQKKEYLYEIFGKLNAHFSKRLDKILNEYESFHYKNHYETWTYNKLSIDELVGGSMLNLPPYLIFSHDEIL